MRGWLALVAEVFEQAHETVPEEGLPLAIDRDARGERILWGEEPAGERQAVGRSVLREGGEKGRYRRRDGLLRAEVFAAVVEEGRTRVGSRAFAHHERGLAPRNLFTQVGEGFGVDGQLGCGLEEALAELGLILRDGASEHGFDLGGMARGGGLRIGRHGDAEMSDRSGVMLFEQHLERPARGEVGRFIEMKDCDMLLAEAAEDLPAAGHLAVERGGGVVLLAARLGLGGLCFGRGLGRRLSGNLRASGSIADAILFFIVGRGGVVKGQSAVALPGLDLAEEEATEGAFIMGESGAIIG